MLSPRALLLPVLLVLVILDSCSAMSIRQLYDRAVGGRREEVLADSSFGFLQRDDATLRHYEPEAENVRSGNDVRLPIQGVSRMLMRFAPDYSTELDS